MKYDVVRVTPVHPDALAKNLERLRELTINEKDSDFNRLLDDVEHLKKPNVRAVAFARALDKEIIGWAVVERWNRRNLISVFVHPDYRKQQVSVRLIQTILTMADKTTPMIVYSVPAKEVLFWARFGMMMHPLDMPGRIE